MNEQERAKCIPTPHITAGINDFAKTVLMPGDPLRAQYIANTFLENPVLVNNVRGVQGYTGTYHGKRVSVMASGMGMPSIGIYSYELFNYYDVDQIIRIGSAGAVDDGVQLRDVVFGMGACTNSNFGDQFDLGGGTFAPIADFGLLERAVKVARSQGVEPKVGNLFSSDTFYDERPNLFLRYQKMGILAVEMEAAALYLNAASAGKKALAICTISDCPLRGQYLSAEDRQNSFTQMMRIALELAD